MTHSTGRWFSIVFALSLSLALVACDVIQLLNRPKPEQRILTGQPCSPPCWQGFTPGNTTEEEAVNIMKTKKLDQPNTLEISTNNSGLKTIGWVEPGTINGLRVLYLQDNKVWLIRFRYVSSLTLGELVAQVGDPEGVQIWEGLMGQEQSGYFTQIYFPHRGVVTQLKPQLLDSNRALLIQPNMELGELYYMPSGSMDRLFTLARGRLKSSVLDVAYKLSVENWHGFGKYVFSTGASGN